MPFIVVENVPDGVTTTQLLPIRRKIVADLTAHDVPVGWTRPIFHRDEAGDPLTPEDGSNTVYFHLDTAMLFDLVGEAAKKRSDELMTLIGDALFDGFGGLYEVEGFVFNCNPNFHYLHKVG